jgi:hypothetical protein
MKRERDKTSLGVILVAALASLLVGCAMQGDDAAADNELGTADHPDEALVETDSSLEADPDRAMAPEEGSAAAGIGAGPAYAGTTVGADGTTVAAPSVTIQDSGNANATVIGVPFCSNINVQADCWTWVNTNFGTPCPSSHFCIYQHTTAAEGGKVFSFFHCRNGGADWALQAWNGTGLYHNSNTGGAHAFLKDNNHVVKLNTAPGNAGPYNYRPIWFVQACDR